MSELPAWLERAARHNDKRDLVVVICGDCARSRSNSKRPTVIGAVNPSLPVDGSGYWKRGDFQVKRQEICIPPPDMARLADLTPTDRSARERDLLKTQLTWLERRYVPLGEVGSLEFRGICLHGRHGEQLLGGEEVRAAIVTALRERRRQVVLRAQRVASLREGVMYRFWVDNWQRSETNPSV